MATLSLKNASRYVLTDNFFNCHPTLWVLTNLSKDNIQDFRGDNATINVNGAVWQVVSFRRNYDTKEMGAFSLLLFPAAVIKKVSSYVTSTRLLATRMGLQFPVSSVDTAIDAPLVGVTLAGALMRYRTQMLDSLGYDGVISSRNLFLYVRGKELLCSSYEGIISRSKALDSANVTGMNLSTAYSYQVGLNQYYADMVKDRKATWKMHSSVYFNEMLHVNSDRDMGWMIGNAYQVNSASDPALSGAYVLIRHIVDSVKNTAHDYTFARRNTYGD